VRTASRRNAISAFDPVQPFRNDRQRCGRLRPGIFWRVRLREPLNTGKIGEIENWLPFLNTYRTLCVQNGPAFRNALGTLSL
jgi:hypothetical protein